MTEKTEAEAGAKATAEGLVAAGVSAAEASAKATAEGLAKTAKEQAEAAAVKADPTAENAAVKAAYEKKVEEVRVENAKILNL